MDYDDSKRVKKLNWAGKHYTFHYRASYLCKDALVRKDLVNLYTNGCKNSPNRDRIWLHLVRLRNLLHHTLSIPLDKLREKNYEFNDIATLHQASIKRWSKSRPSKTLMRDYTYSNDPFHTLFGMKFTTELCHSYSILSTNLRATKMVKVEGKIRGTGVLLLRWQWHPHT